MTIVIGINFGMYVLLAADTRTINYNWFGHRINYEDETVKIQKTKMGLITGAGCKQLLDSVRNRLKKEETSHTNHIKTIIQEERLKYQRLYERRASKNLRDMLDLTGWLFTYTTMEDKSFKLRLGIFHPSVGDELAIYKDEKRPALISPYEANEEVVDTIADYLKKKIKSVNEFVGLQDSIEYHWGVIARLIRKIQQSFPSISAYSQIGVHTIEGYIGISSILKKTESKVTLTLRKL